ncbi:MAG: hypothetical protein JWL91_1662 [Sphingomonas bacterium]|nr:hypothetical protein [Sphingomonas bacterium]
MRQFVVTTAAEAMRHRDDPTIREEMFGVLRLFKVIR